MWKLKKKAMRAASSYIPPSVVISGEEEEMEEGEVPQEIKLIHHRSIRQEVPTPREIVVGQIQ